MQYLSTQIFVYLLVAFAIGVFTGWYTCSRSRD